MMRVKSRPQQGRRGRGRSGSGAATGLGHLAELGQAALAVALAAGTEVFPGLQQELVGLVQGGGGGMADVSDRRIGAT